MYKKLSFVIPAYNESKTIDQLLDKVEQVNLGNIEKEFVLINDCSKDNTLEVLQKRLKDSRYKVLNNETNLGKSQSVRKGIMATTGDLVVIQDADLEYDPEDLKQFVESFQKDEADLIYGNRFGKNNKVIYWQNWFGNRFLSFFSSIFTWLRARMWTPDMEVCYKMSKGEIFREIGQTIVSKSTFGLEPEMTAKFSKYKLNGKHLRFKTFPIAYYPRTLAEGKKMHAFKDGFKAIIEIIKFNLFS